mgnify:CR=1 FL=1
MPQTQRFVDVVLTWSATDSGTTAVLQQQSDGGWREVARTDGTECIVEGLDPERAHVFAAAAIDEDGTLAPEHEWETVRVAPMADTGTPALPEAPLGFAASQDGANLNLRWDAAEDGVTASYGIRVGATWEDGQLVAEGLTGSPYTWAWSASGATTLHLKAIDRNGRTSRAAATATLTIEALDTHETEETSDQAAQGWPGTTTHLEQDAGALRLERLPEHFGAATAPFGSFVGVPCFAKYWPEGAYETHPFDAGQVEKQRIELALDTPQPVDAALPFGAVRRPAIGARATRDGDLVPLGTRGFASRNSWRLTPLVPPDVRIEIDTSATAAGPWDGWRPYVPGTYLFWRCRLRVIVRGDGLRFVRIPRLVIVRRKFNRKQEGQVVVGPDDPFVVVFPEPFQNVPKVTAHLLGYPGSVEIVAVTPTQVTLRPGAAVFAEDPAIFAPTIHWQAMGT